MWSAIILTTISALSLALPVGESFPCEQLINPWFDCPETGSPYVSVIYLDAVYEQSKWTLDVTIQVDPDCPHPLPSTRWFETGIWGARQGESLERFIYLGYGVWVHPTIDDWVGCYIGEDGVGLTDPSWPWWGDPDGDGITDEPDNYALAYPYHDLGDLQPGDIVTVHQEMHFIDSPGEGSGNWGDFPLLSCVPEPTSIAFLLLGGWGVLRRTKRR
jgi:hypothetical protein